MYGPPPDPRQLLAPVELLDLPGPYLLCALLGLALCCLALWPRPPRPLRAFLFITGQVILLTAPLAVMLDTYVFGSFPTIDKEGSLLFFLDGVHLRMLSEPFLSPTDPAARLIGVHVGHLVLVELGTLLLTPMGSFNLQALLHPILAWWCAWLFLDRLLKVEGHTQPRVALLLAFPFGMGLHLFRDLNWYTIEKGAIFWIPLVAWAALRAATDQPEEARSWRWRAGLLFGLACWMNLYLGLIMGIALGLAWLALGGHSLGQGTRTPAWRALTAVCLWCMIAAGPLVFWQWALMQGGPVVGTPERFLWERAALDGFSLAPFRWNRLEPHRALNLAVVGLCMLAMWRRRGINSSRLLAFVGLGCFALSIGPILLPGPIENPIYMAVRAVLPGFWRVAKPEAFFLATQLCMLGIATLELVRWAQRPALRGGPGGVSQGTKGTGWAYGLFVLGWLFMVRTHPAYPPMTLPIEAELAPDWHERMVATPEPG
jgi:hypothetical protein